MQDDQSKMLLGEKLVHDRPLKSTLAALASLVQDLNAEAPIVVVAAESFNETMSEAL